MMTLKEIINGIEIWDAWLAEYKEFVPQFIEQAKLGKNWTEWNPDIFREFFERSKDQCVSSLPQGYLTNEEKQKIKENWGDLAGLLQELANNQDSPNWECYKKIKTEIRKHTSQDRRAATNRIIASFQPQLLCTVVSERHLYELFCRLKQNVSDEIPEYVGGDWFQNSHNILKLFKKQFPNTNYMDIITYPWQVRAYFLEPQKQNRDMSNQIDEITNILLNKKQIILQGAPGTGKTYITASVALSLMEVTYDPTNHNDIMAKYKELVDKKRIYFTTFHQSIDYEDFIEGLKPKIENGHVTYEIKDGIFKQICFDASSPKNINIIDQIDNYLQSIKGFENKKIIPTKSGKSEIYVWWNEGNDTMNVKSTVSQSQKSKESSPSPLNIEKIKLQAIGEGQENNWKHYADAFISAVKKDVKIEDSKSEMPYLLISSQQNLI